MQHCCDENHLASTIGLNSMVYNVISFAREKMSKREYANIKHRTKETARKAPLISYKVSFKIFENNPLLALAYLMEYFDTKPVESLIKTDIQSNQNRVLSSENFILSELTFTLKIQEKNKLSKSITSGLLMDFKTAISTYIIL